MTTTIEIPLNSLIASGSNVRRTGAKEGIAELAASIAAHGLRQNLNVRAVEDGDRYEVVAGGRRLRALQLLAKQKKLPKDAPIPCLVLAPGEDASEISLAENVLRTAMHPDDQFTAFSKLADDGMPVEDIAARFGVTPALVERRLKLAKVSPRLRSHFRKGVLTLEQMMAFTVTDDHAQQERVWKALPEWHRDPEDIRAALTEQAVAFDQPIARFVGLDAYIAAGGTVMRDLFDQANEGFAQDRVLLFALAGERLDAIVANIKAEGWKWAKYEIERDYAVRYRRVFADLPEGEEDENALAVFLPEDMARAGAIVRLARDGSVEIDRGLVHPDDVEREPSEDVAPSRRKAEPGDLPAPVIEALTAHRTAALRIELARNPAIALAATVHALASPILYGSGATALSIRVASESLQLHAQVLDDCPAHQAMQQEAEQWASRVPGDETAFFPWCLEQPTDILLALLAFAAASSVNAVQGKYDGHAAPRLYHADILAEALSLDMTAHWRPSVEGFYGRLTKATLLHIVTEARAPMQVSISEVKKPDAARYVAKAMAECHWLPSPLLPRAEAA